LDCLLQADCSDPEKFARLEAELTNLRSEVVAKVKEKSTVELERDRHANEFQNLQSKSNRDLEEKSGLTKELENLQSQLQESNQVTHKKR
jgi:predicted  nucleic acid-binding Zn-ribbon protein